METQNCSKLVQAAQQSGQGAHTAADQLIALLTIENSALRVMDFGRAGAILAAKCAAADALAATLRTARFESLPKETRETLRALDRENQELQHRSSRIQRRVHALVARLADDEDDLPSGPMRMPAGPRAFSRGSLETARTA